MNTIEISVEVDESAVELSLAIGDPVNGVRGTAWFDLATLHSFAESLEQAPISGKLAPAISGGYWNDDGTVLREELLHLSLEPLDAKGGLLLRTKIFMPAFDPDIGNRGIGLRIQADYCVDYQVASQLATDLKASLAGCASTFSIPVKPLWTS